MILQKYSIGIGDRFGHQGAAQLAAVIKAKTQGINITPIWNKSHREHAIIGTKPSDTRLEADQAVQKLNWTDPYHVDADHISLKTVDLYLDSSDFFTIDVADFINHQIDNQDVTAFVNHCEKYRGSLQIPGIDETFDITKNTIETVARKYLPAVKEAGKIYRRIENSKGKDNFITELSMDETDQPQSPADLFFILAAIANESIPAQTIAPKFTGRFNKGVNYAGDLNSFTREFEQDLAVIAYAIKQFDLPQNLKLSVHSGSDKFSIYKPIQKAIRKFNSGLHLKTAGTTWLEELIGLASAGENGLKIANDIYKNAMSRFDELCEPYATVIDIDKTKLPTTKTAENWSGEEFAAALRHDPTCEQYNPHFRQLLHLAYKLAAEMKSHFLDALDQHRKIIAENVTHNLYQKHIKPLFLVR